MSRFDCGAGSTQLLSGAWSVTLDTGLLEGEEEEGVAFSRVTRWNSVTRMYTIEKEKRAGSSAFNEDTLAAMEDEAVVVAVIVVA